MSNKKSFFSRTFFSDPWFRYAFWLLAIYSSLFYLNIYYLEIIKLPILVPLNLGQTYQAFMTTDDIELNKSFVEWFGVLYSFLLPLILVKAWEQFEALERDFDREADSLKVFVEDVMLLPSSFKQKKKNIILAAVEYTKHIQENYIEEGIRKSDAKKKGDDILNKLKKEMSSFFTNASASKNISSLISQVLSQLNTIIDVRGDRISNSKQRLFPGLRFVAVLASYVWLIPFYFLNYKLGLYGDGLVFAVTALIVFVLHTIEDLDEPFYKKWKLDIDHWKDLEDEFLSNLTSLV